MWSILYRTLIYGIVSVMIVCNTGVSGTVSDIVSEKERQAFLAELVAGIESKGDALKQDLDEKKAAEAVSLEATAAAERKRLEEASYDTGIVILEGNASKKDASVVYQYYLQIPENVRTRFENDGWRLILTTEKFGAKYGYDKSLLALSSMNNIEGNVMYISDREKALDAVLHEMGHVIDWTSGFVSYSFDFADIYREEVSSFASFHSTHQDNYSNPMEYFAESYQMCIQSPTEMQTYCPKTYEYIMEYANNM